MRNSIVYNGGPGDIGGFTSYDVQYSDACNDGPDPFAGPGNICADPKLVGGSDVHQTKLSPTIDKGSDALFQQESGERPNTDYEGDLRPTDGDGDGHTVDMGADETPAGFTVVQPPPPHTPQCSDTVDNDGDGAIDGADPGCLAGPADDNEGDETPGDLVLCGQRTISLVRADVKGSKVQLSGFVATSLAGQKVTLAGPVPEEGREGREARDRHAGRRRQLPGPREEAEEEALQPRPLPRHHRDGEVGRAEAAAIARVELPEAGRGRARAPGQVDRKLVGKRNPVVIKRILCGQYATVGQAKPDKKGRYVVRFPAPATTTGSALYRAETKALARPRSKRYVKQFARAIGITF